ncbi:hypothetical protein M378DRAFT_156274 [Amanita muscaria Koide BX008]|uniref:Uncharacterized protein n=1 Tax=Amanita muscaria (strain Koide BX008) TaxID=946122 RepID=A0A0C2XL01_AMAMK|nr:hypothetical protein M378DRAFT_156274 [Amanita muscaria Koide BX008]
MASLKRKREEIEDSEDDEPAYGRQILPVAALPNDFDEEPANGMEYLFTVRREMRSLPIVTRVANPYEVASFPQPPTTDKFSPSHPALPSPEWRAIYKSRFCNFRKNFNQPTIHVQYVSNASRKLMPDKKERDLWWAFLSGKPETEWNPPKKSRSQKDRQKKAKTTHDSTDNEETVLNYEVYQPDSIVREASSTGPASERLPPPSRFTPREPLPSLLKCIDELMALHLLMYFAHWFNLYLDGCEIYCPTECHARWIFSLLARTEDRISGDDVASLRGLARACITILGRLLGQHPSAEVSADQGDLISKQSCWIIISTVVDIWEQHDLWMDAEDMLKSIPC